MALTICTWIRCRRAAIPTPTWDCHWDYKPPVWLGIWAGAIDVVPDVVIGTVNSLHFLNYEPIARTSNT